MMGVNYAGAFTAIRSINDLSGIQPIRVALILTYGNFRIIKTRHICTSAGEIRPYTMQAIKPA
jgi:hypothetical protein